MIRFRRFLNRLLYRTTPLRLVPPLPPPTPGAGAPVSSSVPPGVPVNAWKVSEREFLMGRDVEAPLTLDCKKNMHILLTAVNKLRDIYGRPMAVNSGYRTPAANAAAGGSPRSCHLTCEAIDIADADRKLTKWCLSNLHILIELGLYMESPTKTPTWVHLQTRPPRSGSRVFMP